jgi:hypothetical protein
LQFIAKRGDDERLVAIACAAEAVLCRCLRWQIGRFLAFEDVSHRGVVAGQDFDDHRIDGYHSS